ncbi:MAG: hypothetical protein QNL14_09375, partial [Deltaproteobacteria bacterium]|nr:hypothetical protein [Deltaproteobacteria bacterium]
NNSLIMVSGVRLNLGVSEVESATVPTILPVCENPKLAGIPLIAGPACSDHADHLTFSLTPETRHLKYSRVL